MGEQYIFAGTLGGQNVWDCGTCGSLVRDEQKGAHALFHGVIEALHASMTEDKAAAALDAVEASVPPSTPITVEDEANRVGPAGFPV